jgi:hypothetical protein
MRLRYQLVGPVYAVGLVSALLLSDNRDYGGRFEWGIFWLFALIVPTILAAFILLISWVVSRQLAAHWQHGALPIPRVRCRPRSPPPKDRGYPAPWGKDRNRARIF